MKRIVEAAEEDGLEKLVVVEAVVVVEAAMTAYDEWKGEG